MLKFDDIKSRCYLECTTSASVACDTQRTLYAAATAAATTTT